MKKKFLYAIIIFLSVCALPFHLSGLNVVGYNKVKGENSISIDSIVVSPNISGSIADYKIFAKNNSNATFGEGTYIRVIFPSCVKIPSSIDKEYIQVNGVHLTSSPDIDISNGAISFSSPVSISHGAFTIEFLLGAGLQNPSVNSEYKYSLTIRVGSTESASGFFTIEPGSSSDCIVHVYPNQTSVTASYSIEFTNKATLIGGDYITITFSDYTILPNSIPGGLITVNGNLVYGVQRTSINTIKIPISSNYIINPGKVYIEIPSGVGIKNPSKPGDYYIKLSTNKMSSVMVSNTYTIVGTSITDLSVKTEPNFQGSSVEITISFVTSHFGKIGAGKGIYIEFPEDMQIPQESALNPNYVMIKSGGVSGEAYKVSLADKNVLYVQVPFEISSGGTVTVDILKDFGIRNPKKVGIYYLKVYTDTDANEVQAEFSVNKSTISNVSVTLSNYSSGNVSEYKIVFTTGVGGALEAGSDKIYIDFPPGTFLPDFIKGGVVEVNNVKTNCSLNLSKREISVLVPVDISPLSTVVVDIPVSVGIKNPITPGSYVITVSTSEENAVVSSASYNIVSTPLTNIEITPSIPDGKNGYYVTQPVITLSASSPADPNPLIYYYFGDNKPMLYYGPIKAPEGVSMLYYYAVDHQGNKENVKSKVIKFDDIPPALSITEPKDGAVLNTKNVEIKGFTDKNATVRVNGESVNVLSDGSFKYSFILQGESSNIVIESEDLAGNVTKKVLHVSIDTTPPSLTVTNPLPFQEIHSLPLVVKGKTEKGAIVTVNGNAANVDENGNFSCAITSLTPGTMPVITVVAKDIAGNTTKKIISIKFIKRTIIKLQINNKVALVNSMAMQLDVAPIIRNDRTLVPLRFISEAFGVQPEWDPVFKIIDITLGNNKIRLQIGTKFAGKNNKKVPLETPPTIINGRTMVPIRFISEAFNAQVSWDQNTKTITIIYPKGSD